MLIFLRQNAGGFRQMFVIPLVSLALLLSASLKSDVSSLESTHAHL
jgi:hypothetical protein